MLLGEWLRDGAFVCAVGANAPAARELDDDVLRRAAFVCTDARAQAQLEAGDLIEPGRPGRPRLAGGARAAGRRRRPRAPAARATVRSRVFKSNGLAAWDLAAAARVLELAR